MKYLLTVKHGGPLTIFFGTCMQRSAFQNRPLVRAVRVLGSQGRRDEQALFVRALSESLTNDSDRLLATELSAQVGRQDLAVWTARSSRNAGQPSRSSWR